MRALRERWPFIAVGAMFAAIYLFTAVRQANELNLSLTAGGQYPYFRNAERMAAEGIAHYMGDRNRMPLMPALLSVLHSSDRQTFFLRGQVLAVVTSFVLALALAGVFFVALPRWPAMFMSGLAAIHVFLPKSSFVQAELAYYGFFFLSWLLLCAVVQTCELKWAIPAGVAVALAYYSKASAAPLLAMFIIVVVIRLILDRSGSHAVPPLPVGEGRGEGSWVASDASASHERPLISRLGYRLSCAVIPLLVFVLLASPYLLDNKGRFGQYFYNVNSTFFMWMDSWAEAQQFAAHYDITDRFPEAVPDQMPNLSKYMRTHTGAQMSRRMLYGITSLSRLAINAPYFKYFAIAVCGLILLIWRHPQALITTLRAYRFPLLFTVLVLAAYGLTYCWYAVVSYGDRFILSLYLPAMFSLTWVCTRMFGAAKISLRGRSIPAMNAAAMALVVLLLVEGAAMATIRLPHPNEHFVEFYFNESREAFLSGDIQTGTEGYRGAIELDPAFAPAHHELAIVALQFGRPQDALEPARAAAELEPRNANYLNTYGSALLQMGDSQKAALVLEQAVLADPRFASGWYNLGIAYATAGQMDDARRVVEELTRIDPLAASRLLGFIDRP